MECKFVDHLRFETCRCWQVSCCVRFCRRSPCLFLFCQGFTSGCARALHPRWYAKWYASLAEFDLIDARVPKLDSSWGAIASIQVTRQETHTSTPTRRNKHRPNKRETRVRGQGKMVSKATRARGCWIEKPETIKRGATEAFLGCTQQWQLVF
jgi:hypothetical protein